MKKYFYCQSYQAFNLALAMKLEEDIIIITSVQNIIKACDYLKMRYIAHKQFSISDMIIHKKNVDAEVKRICNIIDKDEVNYSHTQFAIFCFYLIKSINDKGGKTVFHNFEYVYSKPNATSFLNKNLLFIKTLQIILKYYYDLPVEVRMSSSSSFMISLKLNYINKFEVVDDKTGYYDIIMNMFQKYEFDYPQISNLFIAQTFTDGNFFNKEKIAELLPVLNNNMISIKNHPKLSNVSGLENCEIIPEFLPVELFFQKVKFTVISFHSASLIAASKFKSIKTISLLDIVKTNDPFLDEIKLNLQKKSDGKILFPQNIQELESLIG